MGGEHRGQWVGDVQWGVMRVDGDVGVCGAMGLLWVVTLGSVGDNGGPTGGDIGVHRDTGTPWGRWVGDVA